MVLVPSDNSADQPLGHECVARVAMWLGQMCDRIGMNAQRLAHSPGDKLMTALMMLANEHTLRKAAAVENE